MSNVAPVTAESPSGRSREPRHPLPRRHGGSASVSRSCSRRASSRVSRILAERGVSTNPGAITFTRIGASSSARLLARAGIAAVTAAMSGPAEARRPPVPLISSRLPSARSTSFARRAICTDSTIRWTPARISPLSVPRTTRSEGRHPTPRRDRRSMSGWRRSRQDDRCRSDRRPQCSRRARVPHCANVPFREQSRSARRLPLEPAFPFQVRCRTCHQGQGRSDPRDALRSRGATHRLPPRLRPGCQIRQQRRKVQLGGAGLEAKRHRSLHPTLRLGSVHAGAE